MAEEEEKAKKVQAKADKRTQKKAEMKLKREEKAKRKVSAYFYVLMSAQMCGCRVIQNPLPADSFSKYKTKVIPNKVCIIRLYTIKYCIFRVI